MWYFILGERDKFRALKETTTQVRVSWSYGVYERLQYITTLIGLPMLVCLSLCLSVLVSVACPVFSPVYNQVKPNRSKPAAHTVSVVSSCGVSQPSLRRVFASHCDLCAATALRRCCCGALSSGRLQTLGANLSVTFPSCVSRSNKVENTCGVRVIRQLP